MQEADSKKSSRIIVGLIVTALVAWGLFHAIGAFRYNHDPVRALVVLGCFAAFIGAWMALLASRRSGRR